MYTLDYVDTDIFDMENVKGGKFYDDSKSYVKVY